MMELAWRGWAVLAGASELMKTGVVASCGGSWWTSGAGALRLSVRDGGKVWLAHSVR